MNFLSCCAKFICMDFPFVLHNWFVKNPRGQFSERTFLELFTVPYFIVVVYLLLIFKFNVSLDYFSFYYFF